MEVNTVLLSLGSNMGDSKQNLLDVISQLKDSEQVEQLEQSHFYQTPAWGYESDQPYVNCCVRITTFLSPIEVLDFTQELEIANGRVIKNNYADRTIDIDILFYNDSIYQDERLTIPHPFWNIRSFVLYPLLDLQKNVKIKETIIEIEEEISKLKMEEKGQIERI